MAQGRGSGRTARFAVPASTGALRRAQATWVLCLAPLAWWPDGFSRFTFPKLLVVVIGCALAATASPVGRLPRTWSYLVGAGAVCLTVASLAADAPLAALLGRWPRYEGLPVLAIYVAAAWAGARCLAGDDDREWARPVAVLSVALGALSLLDVLGISPLGASSIERDGSVLGNATDQGAVAATCLAVLAASALRRRDPLVVAGCVAAVVTLGTSGSRASLVAAVLSLGLVALAAAPGTVRRRVVVGGFAALLVALLLASVAVPATRARLLATGTVHGRLLQWPPTLDLVGDHPFLGVGPSGYLDAFGRYETLDFLRWAGPFREVDSPHSGLLQVLVAGGLPLAAVAAAGVVWFVRRARLGVARSPALWGPLAGVTAYAIVLLPNFTAAGPACLAAFLTGAVLAEPAAVTEPRWRPRAALTSAAVASVVLLAACAGEWDLRDGVDAASRGDVAAAGAAFDSARRLRPWDPDVELIAAQALAAPASAGDRAAAEAAESAAREALARLPESYQARVALGVALITLDRAEEASIELGRAIGTAPSRPTAYVQRAIAYLTLDEVDAARADLERALVSAPRDRVARELLARIDEARSP